MLKIRDMNEEDLDMVIEWAIQENWNPGKYDTKPYLAADLKGYKILELNDEPIAAISVVRYSKDFAFVGFYIVKPEYRHKGYGIHLWTEALKQVNDCKSIGLYAVPQQANNYAKFNFKTLYKNNRWTGKYTLFKQYNSTTDIEVISNKKADTQALANYESCFFPANRSAFFEKLLANPDTNYIIALDKVGKITGFGIIRPCQNETYRVGPLYADSPEIAQKILKELISTLEGKIFFLDMPEPNRFAAQLAETFELERISESDTEAMFKGEEPNNIINNSTYAVASLEIG